MRLLRATANRDDSNRGRLCLSLAGAAIEVSHLRKAYGPVVAVDDVSFSVRRARCC